MHFSDIKRHLRPYVMVANRKTTINHAFASAVASCDEYDETRVKAAILELGQDPDLELSCVYCGKAAETWDHVHATVKGSVFSGHGHRLGNLLPCCKPCNSKKGNKDWQQYLLQMPVEASARERSLKVIVAYLEKYQILDALPEGGADYQELARIRTQVLLLLAEGDAIASRIRAKNAA